MSERFSSVCRSSEGSSNDKIGFLELPSQSISMAMEGHLHLPWSRPMLSSQDGKEQREEKQQKTVMYSNLDKQECKKQAPLQAKRSRTAMSVLHAPCCQVEGCNTDLTSAKMYHRRHKVCGHHSKEARVRVAGQEQRFCQQCSRFHVLSEFDERKRSCRKRLEGHNARRRKPQPSALSLKTILTPSCFQAGDISIGTFWKEKPPFLHGPGVSSTPVLSFNSDQLNLLHGKGALPGFGKTKDRFPCEYPCHGLDMKHISLPGLCQQANNRSQMSLENSGILHGVAVPLVHKDIKCSIGPPGPDLSLLSSTNPTNYNFFSSSETELFSGLEISPINETVRSVSDSGCALSLLLKQPWCSQTSDMVSMSMSTPANMNLDQLASENHGLMIQQFPQTGKQQHLNLASQKVFLDPSQSQNISSSFGLSAGELDFLERKNNVESFTHRSTRPRNIGNHSKFLLEGTGSSSPHVNRLEDLKGRTYLELLPSSQSQASEAYKLGELQFFEEYGPSVVNSAHMM